MNRLRFLPSLAAAALGLAFPAAAPAQFPGDAPAGKPAASGPPPDPTKAIQKIDETRFKLGTLEFDKKTREIRIPCKVNMREGLLEYVLVHETGKAHESLFTTPVRPIELNVVLLLLNWKTSDTFFDFSKPERGGVLVKGAVNRPESLMDVWVEWKDAEGKVQSSRLENWLHQVEKRAKAAEGPFIYTGSLVLPDGTFFAEQSGSIIALYQDPGSLVNNPRDGNDLDDVWINDPAVPAKETPVTVIFKPVGTQDKKAAGETPKGKPAPGQPSGDVKKPAPPVKPAPGKK